MTFTPINNAVWMTGSHAPWRMSEEAVEGLLDIFQREGEAELFNALYAAQTSMWLTRAAAGPEQAARRSALGTNAGVGAPSAGR